MNRKTAAVVSGQLGGQLALLLVIPILTRQFSASELGTYQLGLAVALVLVPLATMRLEFIIPVTRRYDLVVTRVRRAIYGVAAIFVACMAISVYFSLRGNSELGEDLLVVGILMLAYSISSLENSLLIRRAERGRLAARNAIAGVTAAGCQIVVAYLWPSVVLLALAVFTGRIAAVVCIRRGKGPDISTDNPNDVMHADSRYGLSRATPVVLAGMLSAATLNGLTLISAIGFNRDTTGQVGIAQRIAGTPLSLTGQALSQLSQARTASAVRDGRELREIVVRQFAILGLAGITLSIVMAVGALFLAVPILGPGWEVAGQIVSILAIPAALQIIVSPSDYLLITLNRQWLLLSFQVARLVLSSGAGLVALGLNGNIYTVVGAYAAGWSFSYVISLIGIFHAVSRHDAGLKQKRPEVLL